MSGSISGLLFLRFLAFGPARAVMESVGGTDKDGKARAFQDLANTSTIRTLLSSMQEEGQAARISSSLRISIRCRQLRCWPDGWGARRSMTRTNSAARWPRNFLLGDTGVAGNSLERLFVQDTALRITVSDLLAAALSEEYGLAFQSVPSARFPSSK